MLMLTMVSTSLAKFNNFALSSIFLTKLKKKANIFSVWYSICLYLENSYLDLEYSTLDFDFETNFCITQLSVTELFGLNQEKLSGNDVLKELFIFFTKTVLKAEELIIKELSRQIPAPLNLTSLSTLSKQSFLLFSKGLLFKNADFFEKYTEGLNLKINERKNILQNFCQLHEKTKNFFYNFNEFNYSNLVNPHFSKLFNITYNDFLSYFLSDYDYEVTHVSKISKLFISQNNESHRQVAFNFYEKTYATSNKYCSLDLLNESNCNIFIFGSALHDTIFLKQSIDALNSLSLVKETFFSNYIEYCAQEFRALDFFPTTIFEANNLKQLEDTLV